MVPDRQVVQALGVAHAIGTAKVSRRDYDFERPALCLNAQGRHETLPDVEDYHYPAGFHYRGRGAQLSQRALERHRTQAESAKGRSDSPRLTIGYFLPPTEHPKTDWNDLWLLTEVVHEGRQPQVLEEVTTQASPRDGFQQGYCNTFKALTWQAHYRPTLTQPKRSIRGTQTAIVTGPAGEEINCDVYGRVKVAFHSDRRDDRSERSSCRLRVASSWVHNGYGGLTIPRVGMDVLVTFLEGDPDKPLITGCLHHPDNRVPYELPPLRPEPCSRPAARQVGAASTSCVSKTAPVPSKSTSTPSVTRTWSSATAKAIALGWTIPTVSARTKPSRLARTACAWSGSMTGRWSAAPPAEVWLAPT